MKTKLHERARVLSSDTRLAILCVLGKVSQPMPIAQLAEIVGIRPSVCSKQIELLELGGFVLKNKSGKYRLIELDQYGLRDFIAELNKLGNPDKEESLWGN